MLLERVRLCCFGPTPRRAWPACRQAPPHGPLTTSPSPAAQEVLGDIANYANTDNLRLLRYYVSRGEWQQFMSGEARGKACRPGPRRGPLVAFWLQVHLSSGSWLAQVEPLFLPAACRRHGCGGAERAG